MLQVHRVYEPGEGPVSLTDAESRVVMIRPVLYTSTQAAPTKRAALRPLNWEQQGNKVALIALYSIYTIQYQPL
jgi:hypothetical protein